MNRNKFAIMALAIFTLMVSACGPKTPEVQLTVSPASLKIKVGEVTTLKTTVTPENTAVTFNSTDNKIATVNEKGEVKGEAEGNAYIVVKAGNQTKRIPVLVYIPETDNSARMIGDKDNKLAPPFYIPQRALMKELFNDIKAANQPFGWRFSNDLLKKEADKDGYYFAPVTDEGQLIDNRYVEIIRYDYPHDNQDFIHIELYTGIREEQNPFTTETGKEKLKEFAEAYGFTENGTFNGSTGNIGYTYSAINSKKFGKEHKEDEQISIIVYTQVIKQGKYEGKYRVLANILYHYHKDHD